MLERHADIERELRGTLTSELREEGVASASSSAAGEPLSTGQSPFSQISPEQWVASNALAFAVRDNYPVSPGHTLVVPRREVATWFEATTEEQAAIFELVDEVRNALDREYQPDGYNIGINVGEAAGQTVFHLHVHVIPRYEGDMPDPRGGVRHVIPWKGNYKRVRAQPLTTGRDDPFWNELRPLLSSSNRIDIVAAFVQASGLELLEERIHSALERGAAIRLLCGDYLHITQERALRRLLDFQEATEVESSEREIAGRFQARVIETGRWAPTFHPKSWQFHGPAGGASFVGSSNISALALTSGVEWNLRVDEHFDPHAFLATTTAFDTHWNQATDLTAAWIEAYTERVRSQPPPEFSGGDFEPEPALPIPRPHALQLRALQGLRQARQEGRERALTVLATGLGKTWLSAFDVDQFADETGLNPRVLFLAHRAEILRQAANTYRRIFSDATFGWFAGNASTLDAQFVFASVQKLCRPEHLQRIAPTDFHYVIVDEVHHSTADSYRRILEHLSPGFMLGLTATPERTDGADVLALFDDYLAEEIGIAEGIEAGWLVPFRYFGVKDTIDFAPIPWRNGKFDVPTLAAAAQTQERMQRLLEVLAERPSERTIVFCCSIEHAIFVRDWLTDRGHRARAIVSDHPRADDRQGSLDALEAGEAEFVCAVDILNEGVDLPAVDRVVMLRPTESSVVFLQQLGRGLRVSDGKQALEVVDFVGNHRIFLERLRWLLSIGGPGPVSLQRYLDGGDAEMPEGCSVELELEAKELLRDLLPNSSRTAIVTMYRELRNSRGVPPTVGELYRMGYDPRTVRGKYGSWFGFVQSEGDLPIAPPLFDSLRGWFREVETTAMTKCFKMVVLKVLLDRGALTEGLPISELAAHCYDVIARAPELFDDIRGVKALGDATTVSPETWLEYWRTNPIAAWSASDYFIIDDDRLAAHLDLPDEHRPLVEQMTHELVDYRLAQYRARQRGTFYANVIRNQSDNPIIMFGTRPADSSIPEGEVEVSVEGGERWTFRFVKVAVNVATRPGESRNRLPELLYGWFGAAAGKPGNRHRIRFERAGNTWFARPIGPSDATEREVELAMILGGEAYSTAFLRRARALVAVATQRASAEAVTPMLEDMSSDARREIVRLLDTWIS